jgi:hypothetical protein
MAFEQGAIHAPQHLVDLCVSYNPNPDGYIRGHFFPRKDVSHETDLIAQVNKADTLRLYDLDVSGRGEIPEVTYRTKADLTYQCKPIASKAEINPKDVKNADAAYRHEKRQTMQAMRSDGIRMEYLAVNQTLRTTANLGGNFITYTSTNRWDSFGSPSSTPIEDLQAAVRLIRIRTGMSASATVRSGQGRIKIAMHEYTFMTMQQSESVRSFLSATFGGSGARILTKKILAEVLEIAEEDILIVSAQYTSSQQGPGETPAFTGFISSDVIIGMTDTDPENDQAVGHEFVFDGLGGEDPFLVNKWREMGKGVYTYTDYVGVACMVDYKITNTDAVFLLQGVVDKTNTARYGGLL